MSAGAAHPSQARLLRQSAVTAIKQLVDTVGLLNERRSGRSDRSADFRTLARWFAEAPDDAAMHRLWRAAFGLTSARHLTVTAATVAAWEDEAPHGHAVGGGAAGADLARSCAVPAPTNGAGRPNRVQDRSRAAPAAARAGRPGGGRDGRGAGAARTGGPVLLSELGVLDPQAFRLFLSLLGDALAARLPGDTEVKTVTGDGSMEVRLSLVPGGGEVRIVTEDGVLTGPEHLIEITDLMAEP